MPPKKKKARAERTTYNYELQLGGMTMYHGITTDPDRRAREHARDGKMFDELVVVSGKRSRKRAESDETDAIQGGIFGPPPFNKAKTGRQNNSWGSVWDDFF